MDIKYLKYLFSWLIVTISFYAQGAIDRDSLSMYANWSQLSPFIISDNAEWIIVNETFPNARDKNNKYLVNTKNKTQVDIKNQQFISFLNNEFYLGKIKDKLVFIDLSNPKAKDSITAIEQVFIHNHLSKISTLTKDDNLIVYRLKKLDKKIVLRIEDIVKVYESQDKKMFFAIRKQNRQSDLLQINLEKNSYKSIAKLSHEVDNITFNYNQTKVLINYVNKQFSVVDLVKSQIFNSSLLIDTLKNGLNLKLSFSLNDYLLISYHKAKPASSTSNYLTIKSSKTLDIGNYDPDKFSYTNLLYDYQNDSLIYLSAKRQYIHLNLFNILLSKDVNPIIDYTKIHDTYQYFIENNNNLNKPNALTISANLESQLNFSHNYSFMLYPEKDKWIILKVNTLQPYDSLVKAEDSPCYWASNTKNILYQSSKGITQYNLLSKKNLVVKSIPKTTKIELVNKLKSQHSMLYAIELPNIFTIANQYHVIDSIIELNKSDVRTLFKASDNRIENVLTAISKGKTNLIFSEQNFNMPKEIVAIKKNKKETILKNRTPLELYQNRQQKVIPFTDKYNENLNATVYYPENYDANKNYPMVVYIYEKLSYKSNIFNIPTYYNFDGFNISLLTNQGYFVALIDTYVSKEGPGKTTIDCIENAVQTITKQLTTIDKDNLGIYGHSFGGYKVNYIITQTNIFKTAISGAGLFDIPWSTYEYNNHLNRPNYVRIEGPQQSLEQTLADNPQKYLENSPSMYVQNIQTPILLWTGLHDTNVPWDNTQHFYIALKKYHKPVVALYYKNIEHSIQDKQKVEQIDLTSRIIEWFDYFLKNKTENNWINKQL